MLYVVRFAVAMVILLPALRALPVLAAPDRPSRTEVAAARVAVASGRAPLAVPYVSQLQPVPGIPWAAALYACGPASAAMVAAYLTETAPALRRAEYAMGGRQLVGKGSEPWEVAMAVEQLAPGAPSGVAAAADANAAWSVLNDQLAAGRPVIALVRPSWFASPINHFVVVTAVGQGGSLVTIDDPLAGQGVQLAKAAFLRAWQKPLHNRPFTYVWTAPSRRGSPAFGGDSVRAVPSPSGAHADARRIALTPGATVTVTAAGLRVHRAAAISAPVIAYLAGGDRAQVVGVADGWAHVTLGSGEQGWASIAYLSVS